MRKRIMSVVLLSSMFFVIGCGSSTEEATGSESETGLTSATTTNSTTTPEITQVTQKEMRLKPQSGDTVATLTTNKGEIKILLYSEDAPEITKNFTELAKAGKYDGVIFHRVIKDFMIQTGDFENSNGTGGYSYKGPGTMLNDEIVPGFKHIKGAVSMANRGANTNGSQFFIVQNDSGAEFLDGGYSIFGYAYEGLDVVDAIGEVETGASDDPLEEIVLEKVEITTL
jgi:cyclophilin family peptidyl-prolyl cis-trans isomerase